MQESNIITHKSSVCFDYQQDPVNNFKHFNNEKHAQMLIAAILGVVILHWSEKMKAIL